MDKKLLIDVLRIKCGVENVTITSDVNPNVTMWITDEEGVNVVNGKHNYYLSEESNYDRILDVMEDFGMTYSSNDHKTIDFFTSISNTLTSFGSIQGMTTAYVPEGQEDLIIVWDYTVVYLCPDVVIGYSTHSDFDIDQFIRDEYTKLKCGVMNMLYGILAPKAELFTMAGSWLQRCDDGVIIAPAAHGEPLFKLCEDAQYSSSKLDLYELTELTMSFHKTQTIVKRFCTDYSIMPTVDCVADMVCWRLKVCSGIAVSIQQIIADIKKHLTPISGETALPVHNVIDFLQIPYGVTEMRKGILTYRDTKYGVFIVSFDYVLYSDGVTYYQSFDTDKNDALAALCSDALAHPYAVLGDKAEKAGGTLVVEGYKIHRSDDELVVCNNINHVYFTVACKDFVYRPYGSLEHIHLFKLLASIAEMKS